MRILVTAFDPFGGDEKNASLLVLDNLPDVIDEVYIDKLQLPTVYNKCAHIAWDSAVKAGDCAILCLGQAGGRQAITAEVIAINYALSEMKDNSGVALNGVKLCESGEDAFFSTLPVQAMTEAVNKLGFKASLSVSAGAFVCNSLLYMLLKKANDEERKIPIGFVHLPYATVQGKESFSMETNDMVSCVKEMIKVIANNIDSERN